MTATAARLTQHWGWEHEAVEAREREPMDRPSRLMSYAEFGAFSGVYAQSLLVQAGDAIFQAQLSAF